MSDHDHPSRRDFIQRTSLAGAGLMLAGPLKVFSSSNEPMTPPTNIKSRGLAATDSSGKLTPWEFERRPVGDNDVLIEIKYASICHSDIHQMKGHWGPQQYP
ncbi:MAG: alcohol dehydrogenase catalytic domain-containing protein, partial [Flavobacteriales bacterium]|nr:alcohol dehydrogenase catalytic domain-containing protein [Flavobacteriales bacterium]